MQFIVEIPPNQQAIHFVDELMKNYLSTYELPNQRELSFVLHELVINAVEAMQKVDRVQGHCIKVQVVQSETSIHMSVIDFADGIPEEKWQKVLTFDIEQMSRDGSNRGRGLFFVQHMVDEIWFEYVAPEQFLVGVSKKIEL